jgi:regulator of nucleoside diphosphate kinase
VELQWNEKSPRRFAVRNTQQQDYLIMKPIIITTDDYAELMGIISDGRFPPREQREVQALVNELARAQLVAPRDMPADVITLNTRAKLLDLDTGERMEFAVVVPADADIGAGRISVLAPIGTGMLGYRVGSEFEWPAPSGVRRLKVTRISGQPEASLAKAGSSTGS